MGNIICKSDISEPEWDLEVELERLAQRHYQTVVAQLAQSNQHVQKWRECFLQIQPNRGELKWDAEKDGIRNMRELIKVECLRDSAQLKPSLSVLDGIIIRQGIAHPHTRREINNPLILIFSKYSDLNSDTLDDDIVGVIRDIDPDVVIMPGKVAEGLVDFLSNADVSLVSGVGTDILWKLEKIILGDKYKLRAGVEYSAGYCTCFSLREVNESVSDSSGATNEYSKPCCLIQAPEPIFKTLLLCHCDSTDFAIVTPVAESLMLGLCWKFLEVSFLIDYFTCQGNSSAFKAFNSELNEYLDLNMPVSTYSTLETSGYGSGGYILHNLNSSDNCQVFRATTFCFNPEKQFLCESPHSHCVEMYGYEDLSIVEYMMEASPRDINCSHPDCGYNACIHKRAFVANNVAVTVSSTHLDNASHEDGDIYMWIEHGQSLGTVRRKLSARSHSLSIAHLLRLMICGKFSRPDFPFESKSFCLKKNDIVMTFSLKPILPFEFVFPSKDKMEETEPNWMLDEIQGVGDSIDTLERLLCSESTTSRMNFETEYRILKHLKGEIENLRRNYESPMAMTASKSLSMNLMLDSIHYLHRLLLANLMDEEDALSKLGDKRLLKVYAEEEASYRPDSLMVHDPTDDHIDAAEYIINESAPTFVVQEYSILSDIITLPQQFSAEKRNFFSAKLGELARMTIPIDTFLWDGEHWRFLRGDIHCSMISCFLSTRIYHDFVKQTGALQGQPNCVGNWKDVISSGSEETCKIVVGDTIFESFRAVQFHALRETYVAGGNDSFLASLRKCNHWSSSGGKSNVYFAKSVDDKYIIKEITASEKASFAEFAGDYFEHTVSSENQGEPSCLAKILGMFKVSTLSSKGKRESLDLVIVENVFCRLSPDEAYDLKGLPRLLDQSAVAETHQRVLVDGNLQSMIKANPLFVSNASMDRLAACMKIDTEFLSNMNVMDYSLLVGINEKDRKITIGIIDYLRGYTLDKHIESWVKLLRRPGEDPTVISPQQYAIRFQDKILAYFTRVPLN